MIVTIGNHITKLRKSKNWSQDELAKEIGSSRIMIGKYERDESSPSIDIIIKLAKVFEVSVDYLLGVGLHANYNPSILKRLEGIESLPVEEQQRVFDYIDLVIRDHNAKKAYTKK